MVSWRVIGSRNRTRSSYADRSMPTSSNRCGRSALRNSHSLSASAAERPPPLPISSCSSSFDAADAGATAPPGGATRAARRELLLLEDEDTVIVHGRRRKDTAVGSAGGGGSTRRRERRDVVLAIAAIRLVFVRVEVLFFVTIFFCLFCARVKIWARRLLAGLVQFLATGPEWTSEVQHSSHLAGLQHMNN